MDICSLFFNLVTKQEKEDRIVINHATGGQDMSSPIISVLMSTYNETPEELDKSIVSILQQTYSDFEFLIINDNPGNHEMKMQLESYTDNRIKIIQNEHNLGLVKSLNKGLLLCNGQYIARMDADDISRSSRLKDELLYLTDNRLDMVGSFIETIDESGKTIKPVMKFPVENKKIEKFMRWGSCICHPTWLLKREVYMNLSGYRMMPHCEDYDFILRTIAHGYKVGNIPKVELCYRIRQNGVSKSNEAEQFLIRDYLAQHMNQIDKITEESIAEHMESSKYHSQLHQLSDYKSKKQKIKKGNRFESAKTFMSISSNPFFWRDIVEKVTLFAREHT